jgi:HEAT repeat protein
MKKGLAAAFAMLFIGLCLRVWYVRRQNASSPKDISSLISDLGDKDAPIRLRAAEALTGRGSAAVPELRKALKDTNDQVRIAAATALGRIGPEAKASIPSLIEALDDKHRYVRAEAAKALSRMGDAADAAVRPLFQVMVDEDIGVRHNAAEALARIGPVAFPSLIERLKHEDKQVRMEAAYGLGVTGGDATDDVCLALADALKDPDRDVRQLAAESLGKIGLIAKPAFSALIQTLQDEDQFVRLHAAYALSLIDPARSAAAVAILKDAKVDQITGTMVSDALHRISEATAPGSNP